MNPRKAIPSPRFPLVVAKAPKLQKPKRPRPTPPPDKETARRAYRQYLAEQFELALREAQEAGYVFELTRGPE